MSSFLAEARVIIRPDTTAFRGLLEAELLAATKKPIPIPVTPVVVGGLSAATAGTTALVAAQEAATSATLGLASAAQVENSAFGRQATVLQASSAATAEMAGFQKALETQTRRTTAATQAHALSQSQLNRGLLASSLSLGGVRGATLAASSSFLIGAAAVTAFAKSVSLAAGLETELNVFRVVAKATADEMERVSEVARQLGADITLPGVNAIDAAQAMTQLAKAGLSVEDSIDGARGVLQLATAAQIENVQATTLVANALNAFALNGSEAVRVADLLTGAANEAQGEITDMGLALQQASAVARLAGLSVQETVTLITQLAQAGLRGSDAGTSLRVALIRLINPTKQAGDALEDLNVQVRDAEGIRPEVFADLAKELEGMSKAQRDATLAIIFGTDALRAAAILGREGAAGFRETRDAISEQGLAAEQAAARMSGLTGSTENLKNQLSTLGVSVGNLAKGPLKLLADALALDVRFLTFAARGIEDLVSAMKDNAVTDFGSNILGTTQKVGKFFDEITEGVPVLDGFFETLDKGTKTTEASADGFADAVSEIQAFVAALGQIKAASIEQQSPVAEGLGVQQILNRVQGFDSAEVRARIRGDNEELLAVLEDEQAFLEQQLDRQFVKRREPLKRQLESALLGVVSDIEGVQREGIAAAESSAAATKAAATDAARAQREADQALLDLLSTRRQDLERAGERAEVEGRLGDAIRFELRLQALIKKQIQKIREQIDVEKDKKAAVRELRISLIASRQEEDALRLQRAQDAAARRQESINLDIEFAEITGNTAREVAARQKLIALLRKQQANAKKGTAEWKRLRNEIAQEQAAIKDARGQLEEAGKAGRTFQQTAFEFLQAQQGFAANLFGNLIPGGATAGLVGNVSPPGIGSNIDLGAGISAAAGAAQGKSLTGITAGQGNTTNKLLVDILRAVRDLNRSSDAPEARYQRAVGSATMDGAGGGTMDVM